MLEKLFKEPQQLIYLDKKTVVRFIAQPIEQFDMKVSESFHTYRLLNWIPFKMAEFKEKMENCREIKMRLSNLEQRIQLQLMKDIANHFNLQIEMPEIRLLDINTKDGLSVYYENHEYKSFTPVFETNFHLPENIGLGHGKAFGFGIIRVLDKMSNKN